MNDVYFTEDQIACAHSIMNRWSEDPHYETTEAMRDLTAVILRFGMCSVCRREQVGKYHEHPCE